MTDPGGPRELILFPSLKAQRAPSGSLVMTQKFLEGAARFAAQWPGPVTVLVELDDTPSSDMDRVEIDAHLSGFEVEECPAPGPALTARVANGAVALAFLDGKAQGLADSCKAASVPLVCVSEYSPRTERQIATAEVPNVLRRMRRMLWLWREEQRRQRLLPQISGLQCSGTPTYDLYRGAVPNALLFFDNRVEADDIIPDAVQAQRAARLAEGNPLRLVFGGRWIPMKGVGELPLVADQLRQRGIPFDMTIVGSGPLEAQLVREIEARGLGDCVTLRPPVDFRSGWIPMLQSDADVFLCPHVQGDPSSTYPEVMSCGLPIVGYDNEAFLGVLAHSQAGWSAPMQKPAAMADVIARLHANRGEIVEKAQNAVAFAREHSFETTFTRRLDHLKATSRLPDAEAEKRSA